MFFVWECITLLLRQICNILNDNVKFPHPIDLPLSVRPSFILFVSCVTQNVISAGAFKLSMIITFQLVNVQLKYLGRLSINIEGQGHT